MVSDELLCGVVLQGSAFQTCRPIPTALHPPASRDPNFDKHPQNHKKEVLAKLQGSGLQVTGLPHYSALVFRGLLIFEREQKLWVEQAVLQSHGQSHR